MNLQIDRLTLRLSHVSAADGRRLVTLIGDHLAAAAPMLAMGRADRIAVDLEGRPEETLDATARRIVEAMMLASGRALP